ncbi:hypothetical protein, partial [Roseobacter sp. HKCCD8268]
MTPIQQQELPGPVPCPPAPVDLAAQSFEQIGHQLDFIDHNKPAHLLIQIEIDRIAAFCDVLRKGRFA